MCFSPAWETYKDALALTVTNYRIWENVLSFVREASLHDTVTGIPYSKSLYRLTFPFGPEQFRRFWLLDRI